MHLVDIALVARAFEAGRALRSSTVRHRRLVARPMVVVLWQLGAEPFSVGAVGWGEAYAELQMAVAGEPRNRDLAFAALLQFAQWFNPRFEAHAADRQVVARGAQTLMIARTAPQVVVANQATVDLLYRLGRRLAYLATDGPQPANPALIRLGRHLQFLWHHAAMPGQQLIVSMTDLLNAHWVTPQSAVERRSLPALDGYIEPPCGLSGFDAAAAVELHPVGPAPDGEEEGCLLPLVEQFNRERNGSANPSLINTLLGPITDHYRPLVQRAWDLVWRCRDRESTLPEAQSVPRRWRADCEAYTRHMDWLAHNGRTRTRQTPRQAAVLFRNLEEAGRLLAAEEACDDRLRMAHYLLRNEAVRGTVVAIDANHMESGPRRMVRRPLVTLRSADPCLIPVGRELFWAAQPDGKEYVVASVTPLPDERAEVVLKLMTSSSAVPLPMLGSQVCFSIHSTKPRWLGRLPSSDPWTHHAAAPAGVEVIEESNTGMS